MQIIPNKFWSLASEDIKQKDRIGESARASCLLNEV